MFTELIELDVLEKQEKPISIVTPHEFRMIQKFNKSTGGKLEAKVIPNIKSVKEKKVTSFVQKIREQEVNESVYLLLEDLKEAKWIFQRLLLNWLLC